MYQTRFAIAIIVLGSLSSCGYRPPRFDAETVVVYGYYRPREFEQSSQIEVGTPSGAICLSGRPDGGSEAAFRALDEFEPVRHAPNVQFVIAEGNLSDRGHYGHLGECSQVLQLSRLVQARAPTPAEFESLGMARVAEAELDEKNR